MQRLESRPLWPAFIGLVAVGAFFAPLPSRALNMEPGHSYRCDAKGCHEIPQDYVYQPPKPPQKLAKGPYHCGGGSGNTSVAFLNDAHIHFSEQVHWDTIYIDDGTFDFVLDGSWWTTKADVWHPADSYQKQGPTGVYYSFDLAGDQPQLMILGRDHHQMIFECHPSSGVSTNDATSDDTLAPSGGAVPRGAAAPPPPDENAPSPPGDEPVPAPSGDDATAPPPSDAPPPGDDNTTAPAPGEDTVAPAPSGDFSTPPPAGDDTPDAATPPQSDPNAAPAPGDNGGDGGTPQ